MADFSIDNSDPTTATALSDVMDIIGEDPDMPLDPFMVTPQPIVIQKQQRVPYVEIVEQPASKALRFRYECEGRSAGSIPGVNSTPENKTFPTIRISGYNGLAIVVVSCVTKDYPYRPHPHNLVGKEVCKKGVCRVKLSADNMTVSFDKLGIQCVKRKDIEEALNVREAEQVDPFGTGFDHKRQPTSIDLNAVRLAFQVFLEGPRKGQFKVRLDSIVSEPIYDKKANSDLVICKLSHCVAPVSGGLEMVLLCEKVSKEDIQVRFFEEKNGQVIWEAFGDFQPSAVHKQVAIAFRTPSYRFQDVDYDVQARIQLRRPSDGATSESLAFDFIAYRSVKRMRPADLVSKHIQEQLLAQAEHQQELPHKMPHQKLNIMKPPVKIEPADTLSPFGGPVASPQMFYNVDPNSVAPNTAGLRPIHSPRRTQSPMDNAMYNVSPVSIANQFKPIHPQQGCPSPMLGQNISNEPEPHYVLKSQSILPDAIDIELSVGTVFDEAQPNQDFNLSLSQLDNVDFTNLSISDIVKGPINGEEAAGMNEEQNQTDSFTRLAKNTIQDLCELNEMYKPTRE